MLSEQEIHPSDEDLSPNDINGLIIERNRHNTDLEQPSAQRRTQ